MAAATAPTVPVAATAMPIATIGVASISMAVVVEVVALLVCTAIVVAYVLGVPVSRAGTKVTMICL